MRGYREKAISQKGENCNECGVGPEEANIIVHHIDRDRDNNHIDNLEVLCKSCHGDKHADQIPGRSEHTIKDTGIRTVKVQHGRKITVPSDMDIEKGDTVHWFLRDGRLVLVTEDELVESVGIK